MENRIDILNELQAISATLAAIEKVNVFTVPAGYFEYLPADILMGIDAENGLLNLTSNNLSAKLPNGYFDTLADTILTKIKTQNNEDATTETRALSPMLYSIKNENVFTVPTGYFENLGETVLNAVTPQVKVVSMKRRTTTFFKYAVAAAFTGAMALGVFKFTVKDKPAALPDYVTAGLKVQDVDQELAKISDADIIKYLEANGTDVKTALVVGSTDNNELPSEEDYLLDEKALDKYLNTINIDQFKN